MWGVLCLACDPVTFCASPVSRSRVTFCASPSPGHVLHSVLPRLQVTCYILCFPVSRSRVTFCASPSPVSRSRVTFCASPSPGHVLHSVLPRLQVTCYILCFPVSRSRFCIVWTQWQIASSNDALSRLGSWASLSRLGSWTGRDVDPPSLWRHIVNSTANKHIVEHHNLPLLPDM